MHATLTSLLALTLALLSGCATAPGEPQPMPTSAAPVVADPVPARPSIAPGDEEARPSEPPTDPVIHRGSGRFLDYEAASAPIVRQPESGDFTLNFEDAAVEDVVKAILGDALQLNYVIDPAVKGTVTLQTNRPVRKEALLSILESFLRMNGHVLVSTENFYHVMPAANALRSGNAPRLTPRGRPLPEGYQVRIVPLEYIAVAEINKILTPLLPPDVTVVPDPNRNLILVGGTSREIARIIETVDVFDVDWLAGMSVGLFPLQNVDVNTIIQELQALFGQQAEGPMAGLFRLMPMERLNAVLVITPQPAYLEQARNWIRRLDRTGEGGQTLHIYHVQNAKATEVADVLTQIFGGRSSTRASGPAVAPGMQQAEIAGNSAAPTAGTPAAAKPADGTASRLSVADVGDVRIIANEPNNSLIVLATQQEYDVVEAAIRRLDVVPLQVLIDATIVEVTLTDELRYGLQWFFRESEGNYTGEATWSLSESGAVSSVFPGFSFSLVEQAEKVRAVLNTLAGESKIDVVSAPSVMVLDNQEATIQVGNQVPVRTSESTSTGTSGDNPIVTSTIQYRDAGVTLSVKPRVNSGGLVTMEIEQEVNDVAQTTTSGIDSPTIQQRQIKSVVAIQSGETVVLGGLIKERSTNSHNGIPILKDLPGLGPLFGQTEKASERTELIVLLTPRVAAGVGDARAITAEFRRKLRGLEPDQQPFGPATGGELPMH